MSEPHVLVFNKAKPAAAFVAWRRDHMETGYVINTYQSGPSAKYVMLHAANCKHAFSSRRYGSKGFTQGKYQKICSEQVGELEKYLQQHHVSLGAIRDCKHCNGPIVEEVERETGEELEPEGRKYLAKHLIVERSRKNRRLVLEGRTKPYACEACGKTLAAYGDEYGEIIEVHHKMPLGRKPAKKPKPEHFALLCPNCHRVAHWHRALCPLNLEALRDLATARG